MLSGGVPSGGVPGAGAPSVDAVLSGAVTVGAQDCGLAVRAFGGNRHQAFFSVLDGHGAAGAEVLAAAQPS